MNNKKIIFMGTPSIASEYLNALIKNNIHIISIFTQSPKKKSRGMKVFRSPVHELAEERNIQVFYPKIFDKDVINHLKNISPDLIIVMAYGKILSKEILKIPKYGCINIHVSILPRWRGAAPIEHTLMNGDKESGITIIKMVDKLDAGPIIVQQKFTIPENFNKLQLTNSLTKIGTKLLINTIPKIFNNQIDLRDQDENNVTYASKINSEIRKINFNNSTENIINHIRAHSPKPAAWFYFNNERIKIIEAKLGKSKGTVSHILNSNFEIGCKNGSIEPLVLQREGKNIVNKEEFVRGFKFKVDDILNE